MSNAIGQKVALDKAIKRLMLVPLCRCDQCKSIRRVLKAHKEMTREATSVRAKKERAS